MNTNTHNAIRALVQQRIEDLEDYPADQREEQQELTDSLKLLEEAGAQRNELAAMLAEAVGKKHLGTFVANWNRKQEATR